jgi:hypothetical protein
MQTYVRLENKLTNVLARLTLPARSSMQKQEDIQTKMKFSEKMRMFRLFTDFSPSNRFQVNAYTKGRGHQNKANKKKVDESTGQRIA